MRFLPFASLCLMASMIAITPAQGLDLFKTVRPQVLLTIRRDPNGSQADLIEAQSVEARYPPEQLRKQIVDLGTSLGSTPRGLAVFRHSLTEDGSMTTIKVTCAIDNVIDRRTGKLHLTEIARAFAGYAEPHMVKGLTVSFVGETPGKNTLLAYGRDTDPVQLQADFNPTFRSIEYRIKLNAQKPEEIVIPEDGEQNKTKRPSSDGRNGVDWSLWGLIAVAAIAVGALVYSLLIRTTSSKRS